MAIRRPADLDRLITSSTTTTRAQLQQVRRAASDRRYDLLVHAACDDLGIPRPIAEHPVLSVDLTGPLTPDGSGLPDHWRSATRRLPKRWRHDYAWPDLNLAVEVDGLMPPDEHGRHQSLRGFAEDATKVNASTVLGRRVLRYTPRQLRAGRLRADLAEMLRRGTLTLTA